MPPPPSHKLPQPDNIGGTSKLAATVVMIVHQLMQWHNKCPHNVLETTLAQGSEEPWREDFYRYHLADMRGVGRFAALPSTLAFLTEEAEASREVEPVAIDPEHPKRTFLAVLCHLMAILENLAVQPEALEHLVRYNQLHNIFQLLIPPSLADGIAFSVFYRRIIRALAKIVQTATYHLKRMLQLGQLELVTFIIRVIERRCHPPITSVELCKLLIFTMRRSAYLTLKLHQEFREAGGYQVFNDTLNWIGTTGSLFERLEMLAAVSHLVFIRQSEKEPYEDTEEIRNPEAYTIFVRSFQEAMSEDFQFDILRTMKALLLLSRSGYDLLVEYCYPFESLFLQFDSLAFRSKQFVLGVMNGVLENATLSQQELTNYCFLLERKRPTTMIMIMQQLSLLLSAQKLKNVDLEDAGLIHAFSDLAVFSLQLPTAYAFADKNEMSLCISLLDEIEGKQGALARISAHDADQFSLPPDMETIVAHVGSQEDFLRVLYGISSLALDLMSIFLSSNVHNQQKFCEAGVLAKLFPLVSDDSLRHYALRIIAVIAAEDVKGTHHTVVRELISILQNCGDTASVEPRIINLRMDVLRTLDCVFQANKSTKNSFRELFGITWCVATIDGIGQRISESGVEIVTLQLLSYLKLILGILAILLRNNPRNRSYIREVCNPFDKKVI